MNKSNYDFGCIYFLIKIIIFITCLFLSISVNIAFYTDETMHKIYENDDDYNMLYLLPRILISDIFTFIMKWILDELTDFEDKFINLKNNLNQYPYRNQTNNNDATENVSINSVNVQNNVSPNENNKYYTKGKVIFFFGLVFFIFLLTVYFISCFCAVYELTQKYLLQDFIWSRIFNITSSLLKCFILLIIRIICMKGDSCITFKRIIFIIITKKYICFIIEFVHELLMLKVFHFLYLIYIKYIFRFLLFIFKK